MQSNIIWDIKENEKICVLDLDDVLANSIEHWVDFANKELKTNFKDLYELKDNISYRKYKNTKTKYRECGIKLQIKPFEDASKFTRELKKLGFVIIILTRRPQFIHKCLFSVTKKWLEKNKIEYDALYFDDKKHLKILNDIENVKFVVEDNKYNGNIIAGFGIKCYLLDNKYNQGILNKNVIRVGKLMDIITAEK